MEIHLFIIWSKANTKKKKILSDIVNKFTILDVYNISWTKEKFSENLSRFYGQNLPANSKKEQHCGNETFTCIIVKDFNPKYERRQTSKGLRIVNVNLFDSKKLYRLWTGGGHKIHATDNTKESKIQLMLLLKKKYNYYSTSNKTFNKEKQCNQDLIGTNGWESFEEVFDILNNTISYVILRNFETIHDEMNSLHPDVDILTDSQDEVISLLNAKKTIHKKHRVQHKVLINKKEMNFDLRFVGDNYYDVNWQKNILSTRFKQEFYYRPSEINYFFSLLYHALLHKPNFGYDYHRRLLEINEKCLAVTSKKYFLISDIFCDLKEYMSINDYYFTYPKDFSVFWNFKLYRKINPSWSPFHKTYRTYVSIMKFIGDTKKFIASWLMTIIRNSLFFLKNHFKIRKIFKKYKIAEIKIFKFQDWHDGFAYYTGKYNGNAVFIKISKNHFFLENEKLFYEKFKTKLSLLKVIKLFKYEKIQILISEFTKEKQLTEEDILENPELLKQLYLILKVINDNGCIHRDVRLDNFMISNNKLRIIDFTFSTSWKYKEMFINLSLENKEEEKILRNLGRRFKPNIFKWNDFYSVDLIINQLLSKDMCIKKRHKIIEYQELFRNHSSKKYHFVLR